jgi:hypothetical protein
VTRAFNLLLVVAAVVGLIFGGYWVGHAVWQTGVDNHNRALQETRTAESATIRTPTGVEPDRLSSPWVRAVLFATGAIVVLSVILPAIASLTRRRPRRERWHA